MNEKLQYATMLEIPVSTCSVSSVKPKKKRVGRYTGRTNKVKKAIVKLAEGSSIELN